MRTRTDPIHELRRAIDCLPVRTREAMLEGIRTNPIIVGAYTDNNGGICPMLAAHRNGGRVSFLAFARSWDRFAHAGKVRRATVRELRVLESELVDSLMAEEELDLAAAIAEHEALKARRPDPSEITARRLKPRSGVRLLRERRVAERALTRPGTELART